MHTYLYDNTVLTQAMANLTSGNMARVASPSPNRSTPETLAIDLDRLLKRLESQLLSPTSDSSSILAHSSYERARVGAVSDIVDMPLIPYLSTLPHFLPSVCSCIVKKSSTK